MRTPGTRREPECRRLYGTRTKLARAQNGVTAGRDPQAVSSSRRAGYMCMSMPSGYEEALAAALQRAQGGGEK